jgi:tRNA-dihydrouridine synthase A
VPRPVIDHSFSVAPMLDWTDRHCRFFLRLLSQHAVLYTEMVTTGAIIYGKGNYLAFNKQEHPVVLQLGGSDPVDMAKCAVIAQQRGYDEININVGCPSDRVKNGRFGACLMATPNIVADCVQAMQKEVDIPVTVKCRIGIDEMDDDAGLSDFIDPIRDIGCQHFIVHARKAWLQGLSPKQNRDIPPLNYDRVYRLKQDNPDLLISINGGITNFDDAKAHLANVDGVMLGREVYSNPYILSQVDSIFYNDQRAPISRANVIIEMTKYIEQEVDAGARVWHIARHVLGLFQSQAGGKIWRRYLSEHGTTNRTNTQLLIEAYEQVLEAQATSLKHTQNFSQNG